MHSKVLRVSLEVRLLNIWNSYRYITCPLDLEMCVSRIGYIDVSDLGPLVSPTLLFRPYPRLFLNHVSPPPRWGPKRNKGRFVLLFHRLVSLSLKNHSHRFFFTLKDIVLTSSCFCIFPIGFGKSFRTVMFIYVTSRRG